MNASGVVQSPSWSTGTTINSMTGNASCIGSTTFLTSFDSNLNAMWQSSIIPKGAPFVNGKNNINSAVYNSGNNSIIYGGIETNPTSSAINYWDPSGASNAILQSSNRSGFNDFNAIQVSASNGMINIIEPSTLSGWR